MKLGAFLLSGSGAMLSEAIHSFADTGNQVLLLIGLRRGARRSDREHHYGYGAERFVFGILSASGIFFVGCGVTVYHGIQGLIVPHTPSITKTTFVVLALSGLVEGSALAYAARAALREARRLDVPLRRYLRDKAEPTTLAVLLEDSVAVFGLVLASASIAATYLTGSPVYDSNRVDRRRHSPRARRDLPRRRESRAPPRPSGTGRGRSHVHRAAPLAA